MTFINLNVKDEIIKALYDMQISEPTDIQKKAIPIAIEKKDIIGISRTGSGKTLAFSIPILENIIEGEGVQALIIAPTRELVVQIADEINKFGKYLKFNTVKVFGGVSINPQMERIAISEIVVGTPGRLLDHLERGTLSLNKLKMLVLDEADKMVDMGFIDDINHIISQSNENRQILLFGATISDEIREIKQRHMKNPETVKAELNVKKDLLEQYYYNIKPKDKFSLLVHLLKQEETERVMIFCSSRNTVELVYNNLIKQGIKTTMIHGKLSQNRRLKVIEQFNKGSPKILIASAVAARGLDIKFVSHVINYDISQDPQEYIHRVGRTARAGEAGKAITLLTHKDHDSFGAILDRYRLEVKELKPGEFQQLNFDVRLSENNGRNRRFNNRKNGNRNYRKNDDRNHIKSSSTGHYRRDKPTFKKRND